MKTWLSGPKRLWGHLSTFLLFLRGYEQRLHSNSSFFNIRALKRILFTQHVKNKYTVFWHRKFTCDLVTCTTNYLLNAFIFVQNLSGPSRAPFPVRNQNDKYFDRTRLEPVVSSSSGSSRLLPVRRIVRFYKTHSRNGGHISNFYRTLS